MRETSQVGRSLQRASVVASAVVLLIVACIGKSSTAPPVGANGPMATGHFYSTIVSTDTQGQCTGTICRSEGFMIGLLKDGSECWLSYGPLNSISGSVLADGSCSLHSYGWGDDGFGVSNSATVSGAIGSTSATMIEVDKDSVFGDDTWNYVFYNLQPYKGP